jgi:hypothetical protein
MSWCLDWKGALEHLPSEQPHDGREQSITRFDRWSVSDIAIFRQLPVLLAASYLKPL